MKMTVSIKVNTLGFEPGEVGAVPARSIWKMILKTKHVTFGKIHN